MKNHFTSLIGLCFVLALLFESAEAQAQYCETPSTYTTDDWLAHVKFAGIDNPSESTSYSDFTDITGSVSRGMSYDFQGTIGNSAYWTQFLTVFIDFNQDEDFTDEGERFNLGNCSFNGCTILGEISIPITATPGTTRMRVIEKWNSYTTSSCTIGSSYAEVEDYSLTIDDNVIIEVGSGQTSISFNPTNDLEGGRPETTNPETSGDQSQQPSWDFTLFPNPIDKGQVLQFTFKGLDVQSTLQVHDFTGRLVWTETLNTSNSMNIRAMRNAPTLESGPYLISISTPLGKHKSKTLFVTR